MAVRIKNRLALAVIKQKILYAGSDSEKQFESLKALAGVLGYYVDPFHEAIIRHQNKTQFGTRDKDLILGFRGGGKSTTGTILRAIKYLLVNPDIRILFSSDTTGATQALLREVRGHLQYNKILVEMFGEFFDTNARTERGRYREGYATIMQRQNLSLKEPTIICLGTGGQTASRHFDVVFADDLVTLNKSRTATQRKHLLDWHGSTLVGTFLPHTKVHYLGTRYYPNDLWQVLVEGDSDSQTGELVGSTLRLPLVDDDGRPNYPERYPVEICNKLKRTMGAYHFNAQMQQDTSTAEGVVFNYSDFKWWSNEVDPPPTDAVKFQYSDLVAKETETGDYFVNCTIAISEQDGERKIWVVDLIRERAGLKRQREQILKQAQLHMPIVAGVEAVAMQAGFAEEIKQGTFLPIEPVTVGGKDKVYRARIVTPTVESGQVYFPMPETEIGKRCQPLLDELSTFPFGDHDDCVDAFVGAVTLAILQESETGFGLASGDREAYSLMT